LSLGLRDAAHEAVWRLLEIHHLFHAGRYRIELDARRPQ
jgi:hypothetical protein